MKQSAGLGRGKAWQPGYSKYRWRASRGMFSRLAWPQWGLVRRDSV